MTSRMGAIKPCFRCGKVPWRCQCQQGFLCPPKKDWELTTAALVILAIVVSEIAAFLAMLWLI